MPSSFLHLEVVSTLLQRLNLLALALTCIFLSGFFALGDADEDNDVDFLVVTRAFLTHRQKQAVQQLQRRLYASSTHWRKHLEGFCFPEALQRHPDPARTPIRYFNHVRCDLGLSDHDSTLVERWVTREHGFALTGPPPRTLIGPVDPDELRAEAWTLLFRWGRVLLGGSEERSRGWAWTPGGLNND